MFHCLAGTAADLLIGKSRNAAWHQVYRALEHGMAKQACLDRGAMQGFPPEIRSFAGTFVALQLKRHEADYALNARPYRKSDVMTEIDAAELAVSRFEQANIEARRRFAAHVLFKRRSIQGPSHDR